MKKLPEITPVVHDNFLAGHFIGNTKQKEFVTRWNIIHHKLMEVNQTFRKVTGVQLNNTEHTVNYSFSCWQTRK